MTPNSACVRALGLVANDAVNPAAGQLERASQHDRHTARTAERGAEETALDTALDPADGHCEWADNGVERTLGRQLIQRDRHPVLAQVTTARSQHHDRTGEPGTQTEVRRPGRQVGRPGAVHRVGCLVGLLRPLHHETHTALVELFAQG
jgi:hypothetical protein